MIIPTPNELNFIGKSADVLISYWLSKLTDAYRDHGLCILTIPAIFQPSQEVIDKTIHSFVGRQWQIIPVVEEEHQFYLVFPAGARRLVIPRVTTHLVLSQAAMHALERLSESLVAGTRDESVDLLVIESAETD